MAETIKEMKAKLLKHYESKYLSDDGFDPNKILSAKIKKMMTKGHSKKESILQLLDQEGIESNNKSEEMGLSEKEKENLDKIIFERNRCISLLPRWKREKIEQDEYNFYIIWGIEDNDDNFYMITDKFLSKSMGGEHVEVPIGNIVSCGKPKVEEIENYVVGYDLFNPQISVIYRYYFEVITYDGKIDVEVYNDPKSKGYDNTSRVCLEGFHRRLMNALNDYNGSVPEPNKSIVKKTLRNPDNNYYVCRECFKKIVQNKTSCPSCKTEID